MLSAMPNANMSAARAAKNDEFYTQYADIEKEVMAYLDFDPDTFRGKTVLLPCDDPEQSNFTRFFAQKFAVLGLKKLISTSYNKDGGPGKVYTLVPGADVNHDGRTDFLDLEWDWLQEDGDFRSAEVQKLLDEADIVVTNPPFSLFREFVTWVVEADKKFLFIGNMNAVTYREVFSLIKDNQLWYGPSISSGDREFRVPESYPLAAAGWRVDDDGNKYIRVKGVRWFTNLDHGRRHEPMALMTMADNLRYTKKLAGLAAYRRYDNFDAIEVPQARAIPSDYDGLMGVPVTFLDKYNPDQFEIIGSLNNGAHGDELGAVKTPTEVGDKVILWNGPVINQQPLYKRIIIRHRNLAQ